MSSGESSPEHAEKESWRPPPFASSAEPRLGGWLLFVGGAALLVRLVYLWLMPASPYFEVRWLQGTDCFRFYEWAKEIASGDLVGQGVFNQAPLYPYFLALVLKLSGKSYLSAVRVAQFLLGAGTAMMVAAMANQLRGKLAGILAGLMVALHGPLIFYEGTFLRVALLCFLNTGLVLLMFASQVRARFSRGLLTGAVFGLGVLAKENLLVMVPALAWWLWKAEGQGELTREKREGRAFVFSARLRLAFGFWAGLSFFLALLVARNQAAGAPLFSISRRGALEFVAGNLASSPTAGWALTPSALELTLASERRLFPAITAVLNSYRDHPFGLIQRQFQKTLHFLSGYEVPNNVNYYVEREYVSLFRGPLLTWPLVLALGVLGMWFLRREWRRGWVLYYYVVMYPLGVIAFYVLARFRLPVVPVLCVFAGCGAAEIFWRFRSGRWVRGMVGLGLTVLIAVAAWPRPVDLFRTQDYYNLVRFHVIKNQPLLCQEWLARWEKSLRSPRRDPKDGQVLHDHALLMFVRGDPLPLIQTQLSSALATEKDEYVHLQMQLLLAECQKREKKDPKILGLRFLSP